MEDVRNPYSMFPMSFTQMPLNQQSNEPQHNASQLPVFHPFAEFSDEDNQLLMSVIVNSNQGDLDFNSGQGEMPPPPVPYQYPPYSGLQSHVPVIPRTTQHQMPAIPLNQAPRTHQRSPGSQQNVNQNQRMFVGSPNQNGGPQNQGGQGPNGNYSPQSMQGSQHPSIIGGQNKPRKSKDGMSPELVQKNKRRESQNRASRNYRQRKKEYIKDIETKLAQLSLENDQLRTENIKNKILASQLSLENAALRNGVKANHGPKPHPLYRSYSNEIRTMDKEIEKIMIALEEAARNKSDDSTLRNLLKDFHQHVKKRQDMLTKEVQQLVTPKMQEKFARLSGVPPKMSSHIDRELQEWLQQLSEQGVAREQIEKLKELQSRHFLDLKQIYKEREEINEDIRGFYQEKILGAQMVNRTPKLDDSSILVLSNKLELLKQNLEKENEVTNQTLLEFGGILSPYQEAVLTLKHYDLYKNTLSSMAMLNNVWKALSAQNTEQ